MSEDRPAHWDRDYTILQLASQHEDASATVLSRVADDIEAGAVAPGNDEKILGEAETDRIIRDCEGMSADQVNAAVQVAAINHLVARYSELEDIQAAYDLPEVSEPEVADDLEIGW